MKPNRALRWLLTRVSSRDAAEATVGDVLEDLDAEPAVGGRSGSVRRRLNARLAVALARATASAMPAVLRSAGLTVRDAWRSLRRTPVSSLVIFLVLAAAMSAATVAYSVVDAVVLRPLPFDHSERIVTISLRDIEDISTGVTVPQFEAIRTRVAALDSVGIMRFGQATVVTIGAGTANVPVASATAGAFRVLRISPILGRLWSQADETHRLDDVAVISEELWRDRFGADPGVIGTHVGIFGRSYEVLGVLPMRATSTGDFRLRFDICVPYSRQLASDASAPHGREFPLARLKTGVSLDDARREVNAVAAPLAVGDPRVPDQRLLVRRWDAQLTRGAGGWLLLILGAVGLVLAIACVNVANVMLAETANRARELAVRASLGASRRQLATSVLVESLSLSALAGASALLFATWGIRATKAALPPSVYLFRQSAIGMNGRVLAAGAVASILTGLFFGLVPAWQASRSSVVALLKDGGAGATRRGGWRSAFLVAEIGSIGVLLVLSVLFISSFARVLTLDLGFDRSHLIAVPRLFDYHGPIADLQGRLASLPGVTGVAAAGPTSLPLIGPAFGGVWVDSVLQPTNAAGQGRDVDVDLYRTTPDLFTVAGIRFRRGSTWSAGTPPTPRPIVIDEVAAGRLFGAADPVGQRLRAHSLNDADFTVVGVVPYVYDRGPDMGAPPSAYYPIAPNDPPAIAGFLVRTSGRPADLVPLVQSVVAAALPPGSKTKPEVYVVDDAFRILTSARRFNATLMSVLALFALAIGAAGIYGVMASIVAQQTKEIGVRVALGATTGDIRRDVLARAGRHVAAGLALGLPVGWLLARGFASQFFEVTPGDASIYIIVIATVGLVALVAAIVPARRAANVDPVISLRAS